jgi:hypothetical protein
VVNVALRQDGNINRVSPDAAWAARVSILVTVIVPQLVSPVNASRRK